MGDKWLFSWDSFCFSCSRATGSLWGCAILMKFPRKRFQRGTCVKVTGNCKITQLKGQKIRFGSSGAASLTQSFDNGQFLKRSHPTADPRKTGAPTLLGTGTVSVLLPSPGQSSKQAEGCLLILSTVRMPAAFLCEAARKHWLMAYSHRVSKGLSLRICSFVHVYSVISSILQVGTGFPRANL